MATKHPAFEVHPVDDKTSFFRVFKGALALDPRIIEPIEKKRQFKYLVNYLKNEKKGLKVKTIVIELEYTSIPFLADYINYYANCYYDYQKLCRRIHFFSSRFEHEEFLKMITSGGSSDHWDHYEGNIVVKPLPSGFIGPTLLKTYSKREGRSYKAVKKYTINLFGHQLSLDTMQYQEQDGIVGSCASAAMGFAFEKTSELFGSLVPSPSEITLLAGEDSDYSGKSFPNTELSLPQIGRAISSTGLVSEHISDESYLNDDRWFNACVYAYLRSGIPLLLGFNIDIYPLYHLVALNGYRFGTHTIARNFTSILDFELVSDDIFKFYAHDDQLGPFTRVDIIQERDRKKKFLSAYYDDDDKKRLEASPASLIIPLKKSIKVSFNNIAEEVAVMHTLLNQQLAADDGTQYFNFIWDIYLIKSNDYKEEMMTDLVAPGKIDEIGTSVLFKSLPQYIWIARAYAKNEEGKYVLFDLIYDAIDVNFKSNPYYAQILNMSFLKVLIDSEVIYEMAVFKDYYEAEKEEADLLRIFGTDNSVIDFLEQKEDEIKLDLNKTTLPIDEYLEALEKQQGKEYAEKIAAQKEKLTNREVAAEKPAVDDKKAEGQQEEPPA